MEGLTKEVYATLASNVVKNCRGNEARSSCQAGFTTGLLLIRSSRNVGTKKKDTRGNADRKDRTAKILTAR